MNILGINAFHGDASACIVTDGALVAAAEEERFVRIKHWAGFPKESIKFCLKAAGISVAQLDHIAVNRDPRAHWFEKAVYTFSKKPDWSIVIERAKNAVKINDIKMIFARAMGVSTRDLRAPVHPIEHHRAHLASAFFVSGFNEAALVSVDGFGDFVSTMWGQGSGNHMTVFGKISFPHSLGLFYLALTQYLGFPHYGDEYKAMGLAPYGQPTEIEKMRRIVRLKPNGKFELDLGFFLHHSEGVSMVWEKGEPKIGRAYSEALEKVFGPARQPEEPISQYHKNIAASVQAMYEESFFHILNHVAKKTRQKTLCLAGGCAMNSVANGKIFKKTPFRDIYIQCAAGDAGGAIGAAYSVWHEKLKNPRVFKMDHAYLGPSFSDEEISQRLAASSSQLKEQNCVVQKINNEKELCEKTALAISEGKVVGWFQGAMEWGPRALGNRSILGDPRRTDMKDIMNLKIKHRESFRPFAPSILREKVSEWFETDYDVPFMLQVFQVRQEKRSLIPAVTHVNGSGRLQTVAKSDNPLYYRLIENFFDLTQVPVLLNTSFNENEPIVCKPEEALECFLRTQMDVLVLGDFLISRET